MGVLVLTKLRKQEMVAWTVQFDLTLWADNQAYCKLGNPLLWDRLEHALQRGVERLVDNRIYGPVWRSFDDMS